MKISSFSDLKISSDLIGKCESIGVTQEKEIIKLVETNLLLKQQQLRIQIRNEIDQKGFLIIRDFDLETNNLELIKIRLLIISTVLGTPTSHTNSNNDFVWEIQTDKSDHQKNFSKTNSAIPLHTDSQFKDYPERYFLLYSVHPSTTDDGYTTLMSYNDIKFEMAKTEIGRKYFTILKSQMFPSIVPSIFSSTHHINWNTIMDDEVIRFRKDTILKAIASVDEDFIERTEALSYLDQIITDKVRTKEVKLNRKDIIFINNGTMLHGRTPFTDTSRLLLRVRFN